MADFVSAEVIENGTAVALRRDDGGLIRFHAIWLRYNALDEATRAAQSGQRLIGLADIPDETKLAFAVVEASGDLCVRFEPENKTLRFPAMWLTEHAYDPLPHRGKGWVAPGIATWDGALAASLPRADFAAIRSDRAALGDWLAGVQRYGFALLTGGPVEPGALLEIVDLFGFVRETNYGK